MVIEADLEAQWTERLGDLCAATARTWINTKMEGGKKPLLVHVEIPSFHKSHAVVTIGIFVVDAGAEMGWCLPQRFCVQNQHQPQF